MATREPDILVKQSLLDRLCSTPTEPGSPYRAESVARTASYRQFREGVKRDIEWLLNTRQISDPRVQELPGVAVSVYNYGLPDITSIGLHSSRDRDRLLKTLETTIRIFEPRISDVRVTLEPALTDARTLRFRIDGILRADPAPEPVTFNTILEISSGQYEVK